jgi:tetratricopeptide (TPR) repeat protein
MHWLIPVILLLWHGTAAAQIFPEVAGPEQIRKQQLEENRKLGQAYYDSQEYEKALTVFKPLYEEDPSHFNYTYYLYCLVGIHDYEQAEKLVRNKLKATPATRYEIDLGYVFQLAGKSDKAIRQYEEVIGGLKPVKPEILNAGSAFTGRGQYEFAIKTYLRGREMLEGTYTFRQEIARVYELAGDYDGMVQEYLDLIVEDPSQIEPVQGRLQNSLNKDNEEQISTKLKQALLKRSQKDPDNVGYAEMLLWLSLQQRDFEFALVQAVSLDKRRSGDGLTVFNLANLSLSNGDFDIAAEGYQYILKKGPDHPLYPEALAGDLKARFMKITGGFGYRTEDLYVLESQYGSALGQLGTNSRTIDLMRDLAHLQAFYLDKLTDATGVLNTAIAIPGASEVTIAECKLELADIYLFKGEVWESALLYMQVEKAFKSDPMGHLAKFRNAKLSYYLGEFEWAKAQLDVLKAATSKLIANDAMELSLLISDNIDPDSTYTGLAYFSRADLLIYRNQDDQALSTLDSIRMLWLSHPLEDDILYKKAEIFIKKGLYREADTLFARVVEDYPYDILADNALFRRSEMHEKLFREKESAMELYQQLILDYPGSLFATESRKRYRTLRGDSIE